VKIAQIAPLEESVPPRLYGGTERVVAYLTDALVELGHDVTLFASGDSGTRAQLVSTWPRALRLDPTVSEPLAPLHMHLETMASRAHEFDVIHSHIDYAGFSLLRRLQVPSVTTLHGRLDLAELAPLHALFDDVNLISISDSQRQPLPSARFVETVLHGLPKQLLQKANGGGGYFAFLGRMSAEKGPDTAIRIANAAGVDLKMAAKVGAGDRAYYESAVAPLIARGAAEFIGEIRERDKQAFLGEAKALLFPIRWPEPFGLVMIEAMACGTPVIAYDQGSVREILEDGVTGFIVRSEEEAIAAAGRIDSLNRDRIRAEFERRFTSHRMALNYLEVYRTLGAGERAARAVHPHVTTSAHQGIAPRLMDLPMLIEPAAHVAAAAS
jgi:glycosyltransferase involved in cell wall biosynthesis